MLAPQAPAEVLSEPGPCWPHHLIEAHWRKGLQRWGFAHKRKAIDGITLMLSHAIYCL